MRINRLTKKIKYIGLIICFFYSCNLDYAPENISTSISESKERGFFLFDYKIDSLVLFDKKKPFLIDKAWLEKSHSSTMSGLGTETFQKGETNQVVFVLDKDSYFNSSNDSKWLLSNEKGDLDGSEGSMISVGLNLDEASDRIRFRVYALNKTYDINHDTVKVAEFLLKRN